MLSAIFGLIAVFATIGLYWISIRSINKANSELGDTDISKGDGHDKN